MRLLFAIKSLTMPGGAERVFCTICSELASRGHNVTILTFEDGSKKSFYDIDARIKRVDLGIGDCSKPARIFETFLRIKALRRVVLAESPDAAVGFMHSMFIPLTFALFGTRIPVIGSEHIVSQHYRKRRFQYFLFIVASILMRKVTVLSENIRSSYVIPIRSRMQALPNPIMMPVGRVNLEDCKNNFVLLNVGRFDEQKDHATLINAFSKVCNLHPNWTLRIVGEGPLRSELERLIVSLGIEGRVKLPGMTAEIGKEYLMADAFVISSRYEAFGLVTAEAMSHGLPAIGFADCPGTNELIYNNKTGLLVQPGTDRATALASLLSSVFSDQLLRCRLGNAARQDINKRFTSNYVCDLWERLLISVDRKFTLKGFQSLKCVA